MKKSRKPQAKTRKVTAAQSNTPMAGATTDSGGISRRGLFSRFGKYGVAVIALGAGGAYFFSDVKETMAEEDLSRIGGGIPTVVQVHDPSCPTCRALQKEARAAMESFGDAELQYLVANLSTREGKSFAGQHGVGKITLIIFDRRGQRQEILSGPNTREQLQRIFATHARRPATPAPAPAVKAEPPTS